MTLDTPQTTALTRLLAQLRPDWDTAGIHAAVSELATNHQPPHALARQAIDRSAVTSHRTPAAINWAEQYQPTPYTEATACPDHGSRIQRPDGQWHCCVIDQHWPTPVTAIPRGGSNHPADHINAIRTTLTAQRTTNQPDPPIEPPATTIEPKEQFL